MITFTADLTTGVAPPAKSLWGKGLYGKGLYSRVSTWDFAGDLAPSITFAGDFDIPGQKYFDGDLAPVVAFSGFIGFDQPVVGDLRPQVTFSADLTLTVGLAGDLSPQVALGGDVSLNLSLTALQGSFAFTVTFAPSSMISGPLWASEACPPSMWTPVEPCGPVEWEKTELCNG